MNFQDRLAKKQKNRSLYCRNTTCDTNKIGSKLGKKSLIGINCILSQNSKESEKLIFYICKECECYNFDNFGKPLTDEPLNLQTYFIPEFLEGQYQKMFNSRGPQKCLFCTLDKIVSKSSEFIKQNEIDKIEKEIERQEKELSFEHSDETTLKLRDQLEDYLTKLSELKLTTNPVYTIMPCVYKLFTKGEPRRNHIGFLCLQCKAIYYNPNFKDVKWQRVEQKEINPLQSWNEAYKTRFEIKKKKIDKNNKIEKQEQKTWNSFDITKPPKKEEQESIKILYLSPRYTGGIHDFRPRTYSVLLENLTLSKAIKAIKKFGSEHQKEEFRQLGYL